MIFFLPTRLLGPTGRSGYGYGSDYQDLGSPHSCKTLKVTSKHSAYQGKYQLSDVVMNGKPSWKWKEKHKVIWYLSKRNRWCITPSEHIGSWSCSIHSKNYGNLDPWNIPRENWSYNGVETESDFAVECSGNLKNSLQK